jgi:hypothetical protein
MANTIKKGSNDLPDNKQDKEKLKPSKVSMDLPDVKDIPGQEFIHPPNMKEFADTTISSDDEEGRSVVGLNDEDELLNGDSDVSKEEAILLARSADSQAGKEDEAWREATLDNLDEDGEALNEENEFSGKDLDVPGSEEDDGNEEIGEEDEENNSYSIGGEKKD